MYIFNLICLVVCVLDVVGDCWLLLIVCDVFDGVQCFSDFQCSLGMLCSMLSQCLQVLVDVGILVQQLFFDGGCYFYYVLIDQGQVLFLLVVVLCQWGEGFCFVDGEVCLVLYICEGGELLVLLFLCDLQGWVVGSVQIVVIKFVV